MLNTKFIGKTAEEICAMGYNVKENIAESLVYKKDLYVCSLFFNKDKVVKRISINLRYV